MRAVEIIDPENPYYGYKGAIQEERGVAGSADNPTIYRLKIAGRQDFGEPWVPALHTRPLEKKAAR